MKTRSNRGLKKADRELLAQWRYTPSGTPVVVKRDDGTEFETVTRSVPWDLCGTPVIMVDGISGGYRLDRVTKVVRP